MAGFLERVGVLRKKGAEQNNGANEGRATGWDSLRQEEFAGDVQARNAVRQQNKIVEAVLTGDVSLLAGEVPEHLGRRDTYIDMVAEGQIGAPQERWVLEAIKDPISRDGPEKVFTTKIVGDKHQMRILGAMTAAGFGGYERTSAQSVQEFMEKYPLPMDFEADSVAMLEDVQQHNSSEKYAQYQEAMKRFKRSVYGKRQEYWDQMKVLDAEAEKRREGWTIFANEDGRTGERVDKQMKVQLEPLGVRERERILRKTEIDGDAWEQGGQKYQLTTEALKNNGLAPEFGVQLEGAKVNLSKIYQVGQRQAVMAYVETEAGVKARSYYRSNSQGVWRYLPDYVGFPNGEVDYYGKGVSEESTTLPVELQQVLARIEVGQGESLQITKTVPDFLMCGTAKRYGSRQELWETLHGGGQPRGDYYREVSQTPRVVLSAEQTRDYKVPPEQLDIKGGLAPDFEQKVGDWRSRAALYGQVESEVFLSQDGSLQYAMCRNEKGQAWVGSVQTAGLVTSTGLRRDWVMAGDFGTTPYDYIGQSAGYGDLDDRSPVNIRYVGMWKNYLSKMPIIQKYLQRR